MSCADWEPLVTTTSSTLTLVMPSAAMTSIICARSSGVPRPEPYCNASGPRSTMMRRAISPTFSNGSSCKKGLPPARETNEGSSESSKTSRTADCLIPAARSDSKASCKVVSDSGAVVMVLLGEGSRGLGSGVPALGAAHGLFSNRILWYSSRKFTRWQDLRPQRLDSSSSAQGIAFLDVQLAQCRVHASAKFLNEV